MVAGYEVYKWLRALPPAEQSSQPPQWASRRRRQEVLNSYEGFLLYVLSNVDVGPIVRRNHIFGIVNYTNHGWLA